MIYAARFEAMNELLAYLTENCCGGNPCLPMSDPVCGGVSSPATTGKGSE